MEQAPQRGSNQLFVMRLLWSAMLVSQGTFLFILSTQYPFRPEELELSDFSSAQPMVFIFMALLNAGIGYALPRFLVRGAIRMRGVPKNEAEVFKITFAPLILRLALTESIALLGFLSATQLQKTAAILPFLFVSAGLFIIYFPSYPKLRDLTR
jgi:hypothetical protein